MWCKFIYEQSCIKTCQEEHILAECNCAVDYRYTTTDSSKVSLCSPNKGIYRPMYVMFPIKNIATQCQIITTCTVNIKS